MKEFLSRYAPPFWLTISKGLPPPLPPPPCPPVAGFVVEAGAAELLLVVLGIGGRLLAFVGMRRAVVGPMIVTGGSIEEEV